MKKRTTIAVCAAVLLLLASCYGYRTVSFDRKLMPDNPALFPDLATVPDWQAGLPAKKAALRFTVVRRLALVRSSSPAAAINNRAVALAGQARYGEAEILLREALAEGAGPAARNNLGVICELTGRRDEAFGHYSAACLGERDNDVFRNNFIGCAGSRQGGE